MVGLIRSMAALTLDPNKNKDSHLQLGILAFEAAKTISRLVSLYKSLSDAQMSTLKNEVVKSKGVAFLNSRDEDFLLGLAWAERLEDLDTAAAAVARIGKKCSDIRLNRFDIFYRDLKLGIVYMRKLQYGSRTVDKKVRKMEKLVSTTSYLHSALEGLMEMEISERKLKQWKNRQITQPVQMETQNIDLFYLKLENQRREVRHLREISLWSKKFDKIVSMMARIVCVVYSRICQVSGLGYGRKFSVAAPVREKMVPHSGPIVPTSKRTIVRFYSRRIDDKPTAVTTNRVFHSAGTHTVGGSGLALHYANVILLAEEYLKSTGEISHNKRESLYEMLPDNLKAVVGAKLSKNMSRAGDGGVDASLAEGWRDAMEEMMRWLAPVARDTVTWQMERNVEKVKVDGKVEQKQGESPAVLLVQTLHFADKEKTEAAIAEVLVGLSCIFRFENRQFRD